MCKYTVSKELEFTPEHFQKDEHFVNKTLEEPEPAVEYPKWKFSQLFDTNESWVLVENGSYAHYFDALPANFRVGPWNIACCMYFSAIVYWVFFTCLECYVNPPEHAEYTYHGIDTWQWKFSAATCLWSFYIAYEVTKTDLSWYSWISYTMQSWTLIMARLALSTLVPFFPALAQWNECLRFPMVFQAAVTFMVWNLALMPAFYSQLKTEESRRIFFNWCFNFLLTNVHFLNLPLAAISAIWGSPARELDKIDLCLALCSSIQYMMFYLFFLDRMGMHFYFIFSPRTPLAIIGWSCVLGCVYAGFEFWKGLILEYGTTA
jgi:hypothetical protein